MNKLKRFNIGSNRLNWLPKEMAWMASLEHFGIIFNYWIYHLYNPERPDAVDHEWTTKIKYNESTQQIELEFIYD